MIRLLAALWKPLAALVAALALRWDAKRDARRQTALDAAETYAKTRKDMDNADANVGADPAVLRDWLRDRDRDTR